MSFRAYSDTKDSQIPWVGHVPQHWQVLPLLAVAAERYESNAGMQEDNLLSLSYGRIVRKDIDSNDGLLPESFETYQVVHPGDMVLRLTDLQNDKRSLRSGRVVERGIITSAYLALVPTKVASGFLAHLLRAYDTRKVFYSMGGGLRQSMKFADLKRMPVAVPPFAEQTAIATFLDHETAKIDALVEEQKRLIELLKEKRQAVISQAVTKGLDPSVPMKDSGVEWLGKVPAHWEIGPLRRAFDVMEYGISDSLDTDGSIAVLRMGNITDGRVLLDDLKYTDSVDERLLLQAGDLLFNRTNSLDQIGKVGLFVGSDGDQMTFASYLVRLRTNQSCLPEFFAFLLNCPGMLAEARANAIVAIGQCNLNPTRYGVFRIAVPPRDEQLRIAEFLARACAELDELSAEAKEAISLLIERRAALISATVTGKIDVRGLAPQPEGVAA